MRIKAFTEGFSRVFGVKPRWESKVPAITKRPTPLSHLPGHTAVELVNASCFTLVWGWTRVPSGPAEEEQQCDDKELVRGRGADKMSSQELHE